MLWNIIKRELQDHLNSIRFALTVGLTMLLMVLGALFFVNGTYKDRLDFYSRRTAAAARVVKENAEQLRNLAEKGPTELFKKPSPFAFGANGGEEALSVRIHAAPDEAHGTWTLDKKHRYNMQYPWKLNYVQQTYDRGSMLLPFTPLDWNFIVGVVMSFVAILFTFDAISGERERGTLALAFSNPMSRGTFLLGKFAGAFIAIATSMLIGMLLSVLIVMLSGVVSFAFDGWARVGLMAIVSFIYVALFIGLGLFVSSRMRSSTTSLLVLLAGWVVLVVLVPNTMGSLVSTLKPIRSQIEVEQERKAARGEVWGRLHREPEYLFEYGSPFDEPPQREALERWAKWITADLEARIRLDDTRLDEQFAQVEFVRRFLYVSPTVIYKNAMKALAGTGFPRHKQFVQAARGYRDGYIRFIRERDAADPSSAHVWYIKEGLSKKPVRSDEVPHFEGADDVSVAVRTALFDTSLLITLAVVCFMMSYVAFLKSNVR